MEEEGGEEGRRRGERKKGEEEEGAKEGKEKKYTVLYYFQLKVTIKKKDINSAFAMLLLNCSESRVRETETVIRMCC